MAIIKCKMCGGDLVIEQGLTVAECEYCGTKQTVPNVDDEKKVTLFARASRLRANNEFDKASGIYESIVADFPEEAEAYWGLVLCKYGIEYVDDPATAKKIPTCHRSSFESVMDDNNFELTLEYADVVARKVYREEAKQIEEIRKGIIEVSSKEEPYDIFICYKETDENGSRTIDSVLAQDIYDVLTEKGYRTFFARITLEDKLGQEYEPYIFAALNSAKIMLAVGTDYEYYNAVWVKNEWSRFLKLMATDKSKHLIPCYKNIDAYDMPKEFAKLQAQDLGKVGAMQDLLRGIEKILPKQKAEVVKETVIKETVVSSASGNSPNVNSLLERAFMFLEDGDFKSADEYCEKALDINPKCAEAYLGKMLCGLKIKNEKMLGSLKESFKDTRFFDKVMRFADDDLKNRLNGYLDKINERIKKEIEGRNRKLQEKHKQMQEENKRLQEEQERRIQTITEFRKTFSPFEKLISAGICNMVGVKTDGSVVAVGENGHGECNVGNWRDIVSVSVGYAHTIGLKSDGTVVAVGDSSSKQCDVSAWKNIVAISAGAYHSIGLKSDGTVVATGRNANRQCDVYTWKNIVAISAGAYHSIGLKSDGTIVAVGNNVEGQCNVDNWKNIVSVSAGMNHSIGLKSDGTVVATGENTYGKCNVSDWCNIVAVSAGQSHSIGLRSDGTVVAVGYNGNGQCTVSGWDNIIAINSTDSACLGLKRNGCIIASGRDFGYSQIRIFNDFSNIETERRVATQSLRLLDTTRANRRQQGVCQHCGGTFKGLFTKKCSNCGQEKDY